MSAGSWFKAHKKQVITHTAIVVGFVLFVIFVAEPLFDRLERIPGEAHLYRFSLPVETNNIRSYIDKLITDGRSAIDIIGWAFIEGEDSENNEVYIVLKSGGETYIFDTMVQERPDITQAFKNLGLNLDYAGFIALIPARKIANGEYSVGIYIEKGDIKALQYTDRAVTKSEGTIKTE
jgi:hypothetical protein